MQAAREAARRMQCSNNLRQQALALHNYHDTNDAFPPGTSLNPSKYGTGGFQMGASPDMNSYRMNWCIAILPFIEQGALFSTYDIVGASSRNGNSDASNRVFHSNSISGFCCPSDMETGKVEQPSSAMPETAPRCVMYTTSSYRALSGRTNGDFFSPSTNQGYWDNGQFGGINFGWRGMLHLVGDINAATGGTPANAVRSLTYESFASLADGSSNSVVIGELHKTYPTPVATVQANGENYRAYWSFAAPGGSLGVATRYSQTLQVHGERYSQTTQFTSNGVQLRSFGAFHSGGMNVALGDGSARFVSHNIDIMVWCLYAGIDDGEAVPPM